MTIRDVTNLLRPLRDRVSNLVARALVNLVDDSVKMQLVQLEVGPDETREAERFQQYGFTSVPLAGAEAVVLFVGGRRDHGLVVAVDDRRYRPTGLQPGGSALYNNAGARVLLKADGSVEVTAGSGQSIVLNGGTKDVALADHTHGPGSFTVPGSGAVTGTSGASSSNAATVKA